MAEQCVLVLPVGDSPGPSRTQFVQFFDAALASSVYEVELSNVEQRSNADAKDFDLTLTKLTGSGANTAKVARVTENMTLVAALEDCTLVACELEAGEVYGTLHAATEASMEAKVTLPYVPVDMICSSDSALVVVVFGANNRDDPARAGLIISITKARRFGEDRDWALGLNVIRNLSDSYVASVPGTLQFSLIHPRHMVFAWAGKSQDDDLDSGNYTIELNVGVIKLSRSEVVQQVEGSTLLRDVKGVSGGLWNYNETCIILVGDAKELFLYVRNPNGHGEWLDNTSPVEIDSIQWHPTGLLFIVGSFNQNCAILFDCALQSLCTVEVDWPSPQLAVRGLTRNLQTKSSIWLQPLFLKDVEFVDQERLAANSVHKIATGSKHVLDTPSTRQNPKLVSPTLVNFNDGDTPFGFTTETESTATQDSSLKERIIHGLEPILAVSFFQQGQSCAYIRIPNFIRPNWRSILRTQLGAQCASPSFKQYIRASTFVISLKHRRSLFIPASRAVLRELSKFARQCPHQEYKDLIHQKMRQLLTTLRRTVESLEASDAKAFAKYLPLVEGCERRYFSDRLIMGQIELSCQLAYQLAENQPGAPYVMRMFDKVAAWSGRFSQSDTIAPLARSAAQRLRAFQKEKKEEVSNEEPLPQSDDEDQSASFESSASSHLQLTNESVVSSQKSTFSPQSKTKSNQSDSSSPHLSEGSNSASSRSPYGSKVSSKSTQSSGNEASDVSMLSDDRSASLKSNEKQQPLFPEWNLGGGGSIVPEDLGRMLEALDQSSTRRLAKRMELLWKEWRKAEASRGSNEEVESVSSLSASSVESSMSPSERSQVNHEASLMRPNGCFSSEDAVRLGFWLECRGKMAQAIEVYQHHGLVRQAQRLKVLEQALGPDALTLLPDLSLVDFKPESA